MPNQKNIDVVENLTGKFKNSSAMYFAKYTGMNVAQASDLRMKFVDNDVDFLVSKNTLAKIAAKNAGFEDLFDNILSGQIGIAYAGSDPTSPARVIKEFSKDNESLEVVGLYFDGTLYDPSKYKELANLPTKDVLVTKFIYALNAPMSNMALLLNASMSKLACTLKSLENQKKIKFNNKGKLKMAKISKDDVLSYLETANMLEISELIKDIEDKFNVSAAAPVAVAGGQLLEHLLKAQLKKSLTLRLN